MIKTLISIVIILLILNKISIASYYEDPFQFPDPYEIYWRLPSKEILNEDIKDSHYKNKTQIHVNLAGKLVNEIDLDIEIWIIVIGTNKRHSIRKGSCMKRRCSVITTTGNATSGGKPFAKTY